FSGVCWPYFQGASMSEKHNSNPDLPLNDRPSTPDGDGLGLSRRWTQDPPMFWVSLAGVIVVAATLAYTIYSSSSTDRKIDDLVSATSRLASASWAQVGKGEKQVQAIGGLAQHTSGIETATADFSRATKQQADFTGQLVGTNKESLTAIQRAFIDVDQLQA